MEGSIDLRLVITISTLLVSVVAASAIARYQIRELVQTVTGLRKEISSMDLRVDRAEMSAASLKQRTDMLARMAAPEVLELRHRETASMLKDIEHLKQRLERS